MKHHGKTENNEPLANWDAIYAECRKYRRFSVDVSEYDLKREISLAQMAYFHTVIVPLFVDFTGDSPQYWQNKLKLECGSKWFEPQVISIDGFCYTIIPSKTNLSVSDFSEWYQNMRDFGDTLGCPIPPPDPQWRLNQTGVR